MSSKHPACETCVYFCEEPQENRGECRRHAPVAQRAIDDTATWWPVVEGTDWCGEYVFNREVRDENVDRDGA